MVSTRPGAEPWGRTLGLTGATRGIPGTGWAALTSSLLPGARALPAAAAAAAPAAAAAAPRGGAGALRDRRRGRALRLQLHGPGAGLVQRLTVHECPGGGGPWRRPQPAAV